MAVTVTYEKTSPYAKTPIQGRFLGYYQHRMVPGHPDDKIMKIEIERYVNRPDNLAYDLYGDDNYWWVIPVRNGLQDPIFDLKIGKILIIPSPSYVRSSF